jgi:hypothetical protein
LNAYAGRTERGRRGLNAHPSHFVERHDDVARRHEHLFFDFIALQHLDVQGGILNPHIVARSVDLYLFLNRFLRFQFDPYDPFARGVGHPTMRSPERIHLWLL